MMITTSRLNTRLHATVEVRGGAYEYANGDHGMKVEVVYESQPFEPLAFTLTADEADDLAGQLQAHAREMRRAS